MSVLLFLTLNLIYVNFVKQYPRPPPPAVFYRRGLIPITDIFPNLLTSTHQFYHIFLGVFLAQDGLLCRNIYPGLPGVHVRSEVAALSES